MGGVAVETPHGLVRLIWSGGLQIQGSQPAIRWLRQAIPDPFLCWHARSGSTDDGMDGDVELSPISWADMGADGFLLQAGTLLGKAIVKSLEDGGG